MTTSRYSTKLFATNDAVTKNSISNTIYTTTTQPKKDSFYYDFDDSANSFNELDDETMGSINYTFDDKTHLPTYSDENVIVPTYPDYSDENFIVSQTL